jgi:hypothetical protein
VEPRPLALHAYERRIEVEDEVVAVAVRQRFQHPDPQLDRGVDDCRFRNRPLLVGRQLEAHVFRIENAPDEDVAR